MNKKEILLWLAVSLILAFFISPFASSSPDGLEKVADDKGFLEKGEAEPAFISPLPDYVWPGVHNEGFATGFAGIMGTLIVFGVAYGVGAAIKR
ncbi:MAG: PDGLE domain-containing protein [Candidatus Omnitrophica bacterium]|nr:PDGLE domain-containing protein [Candidatus Omnitrophota bacterium]MBU4589662.1 PDGLE domain-containing protein [Candidatus Omnitrophota bacterium]